MDEKKTIPWVEKYRPKKFEEIVLDTINRTIFKNILENNYFPNLLFYGPPGTGKTTTIINLINDYQSKYSKINSSTIIHLNASDDRGIDMIRNQIYQFVRTRNMFDKGMKFVVLDEVDYMTKNAQQALKYLQYILQSQCYQVRFCLICNYISKIDESLKNEFLAIRFNQLPRDDICQFIRQVVDAENIVMSDEVINTIQDRFQSDIRSMINFIQLNQHIVHWNEHIITCDVFRNLHHLLKTKTLEMEDFLKHFHQISCQYNMDKLSILKMYFHYVIREHPLELTSHVIDMMEHSFHNVNHHVDSILKYIFTCLYSSTEN
jgi:DNA polymerase III delta prime subunit